MKKIGNPILDETARNMERAYKKSKARIWLRVKEILLKPRSRKPSVNISKISKLTNYVVLPKLLATFYLF